MQLLATTLVQPVHILNSEREQPNNQCFSMMSTSKNPILIFIQISYCKLDDGLISVGKLVNTFSGLFNGIVNGAFRLFVTSSL